MKLSRRKFFGQSVVGVAALSGIPAIVSGCFPQKASAGGYSSIEKGDVILFQGDSITDARREKEKELPNNPQSFGSGYAFLAASRLMNDLPELELTLYNRGISGNKVYQLAERWEKDCIGLKPNLLSILIGVNDYWHLRNGNYDGTVQVYESDYRALLQRTKALLPDVKLVISEPFAVTNTSAVDESWLGPIKEYQASAKKIADEFSAVWVPFQKVFDEAVKHAPATYWTGDGVHPSMAGAQLMAETWLMAVK